MCMAYRCGLTAADLNEWNIGFVIDYINEYINSQPRKGRKPVDVDEKYEKMKKIEPLVEQRYKNGDYPQDKYDRFMGFIRWYEEEMR